MNTPGIPKLANELTPEGMMRINVGLDGDWNHSMALGWERH